MTRPISSTTVVLALLVVAALIGGVYFCLNRGESGPPTDIPPGVISNARNPGDRTTAMQARQNLPSGVPRLIVPGPRTPNR